MATVAGGAVPRRLSTTSDYRLDAAAERIPRHHVAHGYGALYGIASS